MKIIENHDIKYEKLRLVIEKIKYIEENFNFNIDLDRRYPNRYKLLIQDKEFTFNTYDSMLSALDIIILIKGGDENE